MGKKPETNGKLSHEEFAIAAITKLRNLNRSKGIHARYSGFNQAFKQYFGVDPVEAMNALAAEGKVEIAPRKGGVMLYLPGEAPQKKASTEEIISAIVG